MKKIIYSLMAVAALTSFATANASTPAWADKGCIAFVNGTGDYDQNCYNSGLHNMAPGKCYTYNTQRGPQVPTWINNMASETWWWVETDCIDAPPPPEEDTFILQDKGCIKFVNGTGNYDKHCYNSGLHNMTPGKCYTFNTKRGTPPKWINDMASETWWWVETNCADTVPVMNIATFNIRQHTPADSGAVGNEWSKRKFPIAQIIKTHNFDIFGIQEDHLVELGGLKPLLDDYNSVGFPNFESKDSGSFNSVFYKKDRYEVLDSGMFFLAEDETQPMIGWLQSNESGFIRSCTWVKFKDKTFKKEIWVYNTHTEWRDTAALESAKMLIRKMKENAGESSPVILMGDFNVDPSSPAYKTFNNSDFVKDGANVAETKLKDPNTLTFNNFKKPERRMDFIFVTEAVSVLEYDVLLDKYKKIGDEFFITDQYEEGNDLKFASDHYPVVIKIKL